MLSLIPWKKNLSSADETRMFPLASWRGEVDPVFAPLLDGILGQGDGHAADPVRLEVRETDEQYVVRAELPGMDPKDIDVQLQDNVLVVCGEKRAEERDAQETWAYSERRYGTFRRALRLATPVDAESVKAEHRNGVLTIRLAKSAAARPKRIQVKDG